MKLSKLKTKLAENARQVENRYWAMVTKMAGPASEASEDADDATEIERLLTITERDVSDLEQDIALHKQEHHLTLPEGERARRKKVYVEKAEAVAALEKRRETIFAELMAEGERLNTERDIAYARCNEIDRINQQLASVKSQLSDRRRCPQH